MRLGEVVAGFGPDERNRLQRAVSKRSATRWRRSASCSLLARAKPSTFAGSPKMAFSAATA